MAHAFEELLFEGVREAGLCEGCPYFNVIEHKVVRLVNDQLAAEQRDREFLEQREAAKNAVLRTIDALGATATSAIPVYRVVLKVDEEHPEIGDYEAFLAFHNLVDDGRVFWEASRDRVRTIPISEI